MGGMSILDYAIIGVILGYGLGWIAIGLGILAYDAITSIYWWARNLIPNWRSRRRLRRWLATPAGQEYAHHFTNAATLMRDALPTADEAAQGLTAAVRLMGIPPTQR